jgi:hypothetical protein
MPVLPACMPVLTVPMFRVEQWNDLDRAERATVHCTACMRYAQLMMVFTKHVLLRPLQEHTSSHSN